MARLLARIKGPEEDVAGPIFRQRGDPDTAKEMIAVRRRAHADLLQVLERETSQVVVAQTYNRLEVLLLMLVVVMTEVDELPLQLMLELLKGLDGLFPGGVGRAEVDGLRGGLLFGFTL
ncbi:hypothetical protein VP1G_11156 [Cytospora mali]|uniref:Uncharacterized protein n=1 Tax=Cytospora mali TaxID=578113 RepID=A0A194V990_CYTMA|nr:hypothetical protein VP1G_11156 [Valsa mali var. pyri (nom. inval.)]